MNSSLLCNSISIHSLIRPLRYYEFERVYYNQGVVITKEELAKEKGIDVKMTSSNCNAIKQILMDFDATDSGVITRIPESYETIKLEDVIVIKYGNGFTINNILIAEAKHTGIVCGFNESSFIICASNKYEFVFDEILRLIKPWECRFLLKPCWYRGNCFVISKV